MAKSGLKSPDRRDGGFCCIMLEAHAVSVISEATVHASEMESNAFGGEAVVF